MLRAGRALMSASSAMRPVVAVIGTTGVGKSQLAVALAQSVSSELPTADRGVVLSADSMQLYRGLNVITNKVTEEEKGGVEHWGLDVVQPGEGGSWDVGKWCAEADKKIASLPDETLPIICGGTHYFIQHFLAPPDALSFERAPEKAVKDPLSIRWTPPRDCPPVPDALDPELAKLLHTFWTADPVYPAGPSNDEVELRDAAGPSTRTTRPVATESHQLLSMWRLLNAVDPEEAGRWHWRNGRRVRRGLERWWERGGGPVAGSQQPSDVGKEDEGRRARFRTLVFWVYEAMDTLRPRLEKRVDRMVQNGLLEEIKELRDVATAMYGSTKNIDHSEGIFQSIGFKEFADLPLPMENAAASPAFEPMLERMKLSTNQYAKSQLKWIRKQFLPAMAEARALGGDVFVYVVPGGPEGEEAARGVLDAFLSRKDMPASDSIGHPQAAELLKQLSGGSPPKVPNTTDRQLLNARTVCELCSQPGEPFSVEKQRWKEHLQSKGHRRRSKFSNITREEWIASERAKGAARKLQRESLQSGSNPSNAASEDKA